MSEETDYIEGIKICKKDTDGVEEDDFEDNG